MSQPLYLFDLDGTLADIEHRLQHINGDHKDWDAFYESCTWDHPIWEVINLAISLRKAGNAIWILTGRSDQVFARTVAWLLAHSVPHDRLLMRREGDHRPDYQVKQDMLDNMNDEDRGRVVMAFEDRDQVVKMYRDNGIRCLQVAPGDF